MADETNDAYRVAEEEPPVGERRYRVSAPSRVLGHSPGETFSADIETVQEARLLDSGALVREEEIAEQSRDDLDALAQVAGVEGPHKLPNKQAVIDAIDTAPQP